MPPLSRCLLIGLVVLVPAAANACRVESGSSYRPTVSQTERTVMIEQADRLVIVMADGRTVEQIKTFESAADSAGRAMPVQVTIAPDAHGEGGAIVLIDDRRIQATGDAIVESIPRPAGRSAPCSEALNDIENQDLTIPPSSHIRVMTTSIVGRAKAIAAHLREVIGAAVAIAAAAKELMERVDFEAPTWFGERR